MSKEPDPFRDRGLRVAGLLVASCHVGGGFRAAERFYLKGGFSRLAFAGTLLESTLWRFARRLGVSRL
jgi:hypothetical protein